MITCGRCTKDAKAQEYEVLVEVGKPVQHDTVDEVRACYAAPAGRLEAALLGWYEDEARAEKAAEARNERFWEDRGANDGFEEWERAQGKISYEEARLMAEGR